MANCTTVRYVDYMERAEWKMFWRSRKVDGRVQKVVYSDFVPLGQHFLCASIIHYVSISIFLSLSHPLMGPIFVYFLCTRVAPLCVFQWIIYLSKKKKWLKEFLANAVGPVLDTSMPHLFPISMVLLLRPCLKISFLFSSFSFHKKLDI